MIARLIHWSIGYRFLVLLATVMLTAWGAVSMLRTPLDALPDLSDTQVIIRTSWPGQAPQMGSAHETEKFVRQGDVKCQIEAYPSLVSGYEAGKRQNRVAFRID